MDVVPQEVGNISTRDTAEKHLVEKGATAELIAQWKSALEKCDRAKYSVGESPTDTTKFLEETKGLLNHLRRLTS